MVIVDHGSRKRASNDMLHEFGALYGQLTGHDLVEVAHMEIAEPTIAQAVGESVHEEPYTHVLSHACGQGARLLAAACQGTAERDEHMTRRRVWTFETDICARVCRCLASADHIGWIGVMP